MFFVDRQQSLDFETTDPPGGLSIPGLAYFGKFINRSTHDDLIESIDQQPWENSLKRRVQQYGFRYDYKKQTIDRSDWLGELPLWLNSLADLLVAKGFYKTKADQVIVNEYLPGQGIASHIDQTSCFGETILIVSLSSPVVMDFSHASSHELFPYLLGPCSLLVLKGDARFDWKHGIASRKRDRFQGETYLRKRRISLTFREVVV